MKKNKPRREKTMKQFMKTMCVLTLMVGLVFSANSRVLKSEMKLDRMKRVEPDYRNGMGAMRDACPITGPGGSSVAPSENDADPFSGTGFQTYMSVIDSSTNGYGMVATVTRPFDVNSDGNMLVVYRQYAGENTTHGQLGAGYGVVASDGAVQWDVQYNVNYNGNPPWGDPGGGGVGGVGCTQARYPSAIASEEYPYAVWNEYTGGPPTSPPWPSECSNYGGRPYFSYDEFGWGGESWLYPAELDPLYDCAKDLWQGSVGYSYDETTGEHHVSAVYDDWTRTGSYIFTSEAVDDGYIVLGTETLAVNPQHLGTDGYSSSAILSMNANGQGLMGVDGIFAGNDPENDACVAPASSITCNKTPMFRTTDNFGSSWDGDREAFDFYYVPDEVFDDIFENWPSTDIDPCTGEISQINDYWSWYEFDMRVDQSGNPHIVISLIAESDNYFHFLDGYTGFYHLTVDRNQLPGGGLTDGDPTTNPVNECIDENDNVIDGCTPTGWNWSYIPLPANDSFTWNRPDGYSYLYGSMCQISLSRDSEDVVYMVANIADQGDMAPEHDANGDGIEDDPCGTQNAPYELYPEWSEDIWVAKSSDNGSTWTALQNLTQTPKANSGDDWDGSDFAASCSPEEQYVHTAHWSDDERVYYQYNQPNWKFNEIGDPLGADHMNRVFLGYSYVEETGVGGCTDANNCSYDADAAFDNGSCGSGVYTCPDGSSGCGCDGSCGDTLEPPQVEDCNGVCNGGAVVLCNPGGGEYCADAGTEICNQSSWEAGDCSDLNEWYDCDSEHCGTNDPLFYETGCADEGYVPCTGGRCYTCEDASITTQGDCTGAGLQWQVPTDDAGDLITSSADCPTFVADGDEDDGWVPFISDGDDTNGEEWEGGDPDECYCTASSAAGNCEVSCPALGDVNGDGGWNVLDIVSLANCVLAQDCADLENGCAGDMNGDGGWNVLDIVALANCVLAQNCGGRVNDATEASLIMEDNAMYIKADGFIGGVQMTLTHGADFSIDMTDRALFADYLTNENETRLLVITPETDRLFSFNGEFQISEIIVANTQYEVPVDLPLATSFSLHDAYPNPFNPTTTLRLEMPLSGEMNVEIYNLLGQSVATLASGYMDAGKYDLTWDASNASSGMYFVKAQADGFTKTQKLMLIK